MATTRLDDDSVTRLRLALGATVRSLDRRTNRDDVPRSQLNVMFTIAGRERISLADLAAYEGINPTMLSRIVGKLEAGGLVRRVTDEDDRRVAHVEITPEGLKVAQDQRAVRTRIYAEVLAELGPDSQRALLAAIPALEELAALVRTPG